jgi:hypothetical protein
MNSKQFYSRYKHVKQKSEHSKNHRNPKEKMPRLSYPGIGIRKRLPLNSANLPENGWRVAPLLSRQKNKRSFECQRRSGGETLKRKKKNKKIKRI